LKKKTKFSFDMKELWDCLCSWTKYENLRRHGHLDAQTTGLDTETLNDAVSIF
jgi:hypothetical protein